MKMIQKLDEVAVLRTNFSNNIIWETICERISLPESENGFIANVIFINNLEYERIDQKNIASILPPGYEHDIIFLVDKETVNDNEYPVLCVGLEENLGESFRVIPSHIWSVENNLSLVNMEFNEFLESVDHNGVFRGFK